jgi:hypothetical protein
MGIKGRRLLLEGERHVHREMGSCARKTTPTPTDGPSLQVDPGTYQSPPSCKKKNTPHLRTLGALSFSPPLIPLLQMPKSGCAAADRFRPTPPAVNSGQRRRRLIWANTAAGRFRPTPPPVNSGQRRRRLIWANAAAGQFRPTQPPVDSGRHLYRRCEPTPLNAHMCFPHLLPLFLVRVSRSPFPLPRTTKNHRPLCCSNPTAAAASTNRPQKE